MKAVFDVKPGSGYDDEIARRYHFPAKSTYLQTVRQSIGDWVVYREPQRNRGRRAYVAVARVVGLEPDRDHPKHYYAYVDNYLEFPTPVPFVVDGRYAEALLRQVSEPSRVGQALQGKSMRPISADDFDRIVLAGIAETLAPDNAIRLGLDPSLPAEAAPGFAEPEVAFDFGELSERRVDQILLNRKVRDVNFRLEVCRAYDDRCAVTGLKIINGGGRAEVQAAHIKPVSAGGPDIVQNGIALSATVHWLFDRHLISINDDYELLVAHNRVPEELRRLFRPGTIGLHLPSDRRLWPRPSFLAYHREAYVGIH